MDARCVLPGQGQKEVMQVRSEASRVEAHGVDGKRRRTLINDEFIMLVNLVGLKALRLTRDLHIFCLRIGAFSVVEV